VAAAIRKAGEFQALGCMDPPWPRWKEMKSQTFDAC
jgi:hypothetical protein